MFGVRAKIGRGTDLCRLVAFLLLFICIYTFFDCFEHKVKAASSLATSGNIYQTTQHHSAEDFFLNRNQHRCAKLTLSRSNVC